MANTNSNLELGKIENKCGFHIHMVLFGVKSDIIRYDITLEEAKDLINKAKKECERAGMEFQLIEFEEVKVSVKKLKF
jgi:hypothetical protein